MAPDISALWRARLNKVLGDVRKGRNSDAADIYAISRVETFLTDFIHAEILRNVRQFFPNVSETDVPQVFSTKGQQVVLNRIERSAYAKSTLCIIVLDRNQRGVAEVVHDFVGFPALSGIERCEIRCLPGVRANAAVLQALINDTFKIGYEWALGVFSELVQRNLDEAGRDLYDVLYRQLIQVRPEITRTLLLAIHYRDTEFCVFSQKAIKEYAHSISVTDVLAPTNNLPKFAQFLFVVLRDQYSPFREVIKSWKPLTCDLVGGDAQYYKVGDDFVRFMRATYGSSVILFPIAKHNELSVGCNLRPSDRRLLEGDFRALDAPFSVILERNHRQIEKSLSVLKTLADALRPSHRHFESGLVGQLILHIPQLAELAEFVGHVLKELAQKPPHV